MIYDSGSFDNLERTVKSTVYALKKVNAEFDGIICTGISGVSVGSPVALALKKPLFVLRKTGDNTHHSHRIKGSQGFYSIIGWPDFCKLNKNFGENSRLLFLDDLIDSGRTLMRVAKSLDAYSGTIGYPKGIHISHVYLYDRCQCRFYEDPLYELYGRNKKLPNSLFTLAMKLNTLLYPDEEEI